MGNVSMYHSPQDPDTIPNECVVVTWPLSQDLMAEWWFPEQAQLISGGRLEQIFGGCAYVVPRKHVQTDLVGVHPPDEVEAAVRAAEETTSDGDGN